MGRGHTRAMARTGIHPRPVRARSLRAEHRLLARPLRGAPPPAVRPSPSLRRAPRRLRSRSDPSPCRRRVPGRRGSAVRAAGTGVLERD